MDDVVIQLNQNCLSGVAIWFPTAAEYHDVILDDHFIPAMRERLATITTEQEQTIMLKLVKYAEKLVIQLSEVRECGSYAVGSGAADGLSLSCMGLM